MHIGRAPWTHSDPCEIRGMFRLNSKRAPQCCFAEHILRVLVKILQFGIVHLLENINNFCRKLTIFLLYTLKPFIKKVVGFFCREKKAAYVKTFKYVFKYPF